MVILLHFHFFFFRSQKRVVKNSLVRVLMWKLVHSNFNPVIYFLEDAVTHYWPTPCLMNWYMWSRWPRLGRSGNSHWIVSTYKWNYTIFVFLCLIYFGYNNVLTFIHVIANGKISVLIMAKNILLYIFRRNTFWTAICFNSELVLVMFNCLFPLFLAFDASVVWFFWHAWMWPGYQWEEWEVIFLLLF